MSKKSPSDLMAGMTMGVDFLSKFQERIMANGGSPLLLRHMTLPDNASKLDELARFAISQHFPVPRSEIERRAYEESSRQFDYVEAFESDRHYLWGILDLTKDYGIPIDQMGDQNGTSIPSEVRSQIEGKPLSYPLVIDMKGERYVVVALYLEEEPNPIPGMIPKKVDTLFLSLVKYFDLEH